MIKAVIFDFFDVIRDDGFNRWLREHGLTQEGEILAATQRHDRGELGEAEFMAELGRISGQQAEQVIYELEHENELNELLVQYIGELRPEYKIALLSNSASDYLRNEIAKYRLDPYFDEIVISSEVGLIKPEPAVFELITRRLGVSATECVFTDDNPKYVAGAEAVGIHGILFQDTAQFRRDLEALIGSQ